MRSARPWTLFFLLAACTQNEDPNTSGYWIARLKNETQRTEALMKLGQLGDKSALPEATKWFKKEGDWQPKAAYAVGQLGDASTAAVLIEGLDFEVGASRDRAAQRKNSVNQAVARALAQLGAKEAVDPLLRLLASRDDRTRVAVVGALGQLRDRRASAPLVDLALNEPQPLLRKTAIEALGNLGDQAAVPALIQNLYVELPGVSFYNEARFALQQVGAPAVPNLLETLGRKNAEVENIRLRNGEPLAEGAIEAKAAFVLGSLRVAEAEGPIIAVLNGYYKKFQNRDKEPVFASVQGAVMEMCYALGSLGSAKAIETLTMLVQDTDANIRVSAADALTMLGNASIVPQLIKAAGTGDLDARRHAIVAASRLGHAEHLAAYDALAKTPGEGVDAGELQKVLTDHRVRLAAAQACGRDVACWQQKLTDGDAKVRERAAFELGWKGAQAAVADLTRALEDKDALVRLAAQSSLRRMTPNLKAETLQLIHDKWSQDELYRDATADLRRLIALVRQQ